MKRQNVDDGEQQGNNLRLPDFGNIEMPDLDLAFFDILNDDEADETRYLKPRAKMVNENMICYDNAVKLANELRVDKGQRADVVVGGNFIFGDFIEAYVTTHAAFCKKMTISTLSLSQENVDSLRNLLDAGYVEQLDLIVSLYFYGHEAHQLIPYIYRELDHDNKFQLAVAGMHTKIAQFETLGGRKVVIHGSANLRSSANVEQFCIEENEELYDFYDDVFENVIEKYKTINKPIPRRDTWATVTRKRFKDD